MNAIVIIAQMSDATFYDVVNASSRKVREILFSKLGIKSQTKKTFSVGLKHQDKRDERSRLLKERLSKGKTKQEAEVCTELLRNWLMQKRPMLKNALDFLEIPNDNGLVETETDFFKDLSKEKVEALKKHLYSAFSQEEVDVYLRFMEVPHLS